MSDPLNSNIEVETKSLMIFADKRMSGEWFNLGDDDVERFKTITAAELTQPGVPA